MAWITPTSGLLRGAWLINFNETQKSDFYPVPLRLQCRICSIKTEAVAEAAVLKDIFSQALFGERREPLNKRKLFFGFKIKQKRKGNRLGEQKTAD